MKRIIFVFLILMAAVLCTTAQEHDRKERRKFSREEFQERQKAFIMEHAQLSAKEAESFFPLFFELQKKKWQINKEAREKAGIRRGEECSEEKCTLMINEFADAKIKIAELEKEYIGLYLKVLSAHKILNVQHAEERFQKEMLKNMWERRKNRPEKRKEEK